jgi:hypothetical protein
MIVNPKFTAACRILLFLYLDGISGIAPSNVQKTINRPPERPSAQWAFVPVFGSEELFVPT